jgi:hypothetical protein
VDLSIDWSWLGSHVGAMYERFLQHLQLVVIAVVAGFVISLALGIWAYRRRRAYAWIILVAGLLYTIPSLAAFALLRPVTGLTLLTALIPLTTYTLLILVRANVAGFDSVPADVLEAAEGWATPVGSGCSVSSCHSRCPDHGRDPPGDRHDDRAGDRRVDPGRELRWLRVLHHGGPEPLLPDRDPGRCRPVDRVGVRADFLLVRVERRITPWARVRAGAR